MSDTAGIQLETVIATGHEVELLYQEQQALIRRQQEVEINQLIALLGSGDSGSSKKPLCSVGTRVSLLKRISQWIEAPPVGDRRGLCLIGAAGRGKSSVGASVAEDKRTSKPLGAEFYFTVDEQKRNEGVIPVLARQLAFWGDKRLRIEIASALHANRELAQGRLEKQSESLIQKPLETFADDPDCPPLAILLDGLDECTKEYASRLLHLIGQNFAKLPVAVRFILTSRPEPHLLYRYASEPLDVGLHVCSLNLEDAGEVAKDIEAFFRRELPQMISGTVKKPLNRPGEERLLIPVRMSGGLWIWAATVVRMLADEKFRDPEKQLDANILSIPNNRGKHGHNTDLYAVYSMVLSRACPPDSELFALFGDVLGGLCILESINTHRLTLLLCLDKSNS